MQYAERVPQTKNTLGRKSSSGLLGLAKKQGRAVHKPFAVFDIDGTLIRWQLYHAVADRLALNGYFDKKHYEVVKQARMVWKKRASEDSFKQYERELVKLVDEALTGISPNDLKQASREVMEEYKDQVYTYTRDLVRRLKAQGYLLFAISGSQQEIVEMLAGYYGFDDFAGSEHEIINGSYTGKKMVLKSDKKPAVLTKLIKKHGATSKSSIGVGDSESDIPMLETVETAIAFNPTQLLFEHANAKHWQIVVERKNVIYQLENQDGKYVLAQTDK